MKNSEKIKAKLTEDMEKIRQRVATLETLIKKLKREREFTDSIINSILDTIFVFDANTGKPVIWNQAFRDITGFTDEEIATKKAPDDWYSKDDLQKLKLETEKLLKGEKSRVEGTLITKDGKVIPTEYTASLIKRMAGKSNYIIAIGRDITLRKEVEGTLRESEEKFAKAFNANPDAITIATLKDGKFIEVNDGYTRDTGYTREEVIGHSALDLNTWVSPDERNRIIRLLEEQGQISNEEIILRTKSGELHNVLYSAAKIYIRGEECIIDISTDITERKRIEEIYRTIVDHSLQGLAIVQDFRFTFVNKALAEFSGYTVEELLGFAPEDMQAMIHPEDREYVFGIAQKRLNGGQVRARFEFRYVRKDGKIKWAEQYARLIEYKGKPAVIVTYNDITERKRAEEALRESEEKYHSLVEHGNDGIVFVQDGVFQYVNSKMLEMSGYTAEELTGKTFLSFVAPEHKEIVSEMYRERIAGEKVPERYELNLIAKGGRTLYTEISASLFIYQGKTADMAIVRDITERKRAEEALRESEDKFQSLVEHSNDGIVFVQDGLVQYFNSKILEMSGYTAEELTGKTFLSFVAPEHKEMVSEMYRERIAGEKVPESYELNLIAKGGRTLYTEISVSLFNYKQQLVDIVIIRDITERKQVERALRASEERYRGIVEQSLVGIGLSLGDQILFANKALLRIFNYDTLEEMAKTPLLDHVAPSSRKFIADRMKLAAEGKNIPPEFEYDILCGGGGTKTVLAYSTHSFLEGKNYTQTIFQDITERKQAEEKLASSERRFRSLFEKAIDGMLLLNKDATFIDSNAKAAEFYRRSQEEILNRTPWDFSPPQQPDGRNSKDKALEKINAAFQGHPQLFEWVHSRSDGSLMDAEINLSSIELEEETAVLAIVRDITERKNIEKRMQETREIERTRLARELHDTVSQTLASIGLIAEALPRIWQKDQSEADEHLQELVTLTRGVQEEMRSLQFELYPAALVNKDLDELIHQLADNVERHYQFPVSVSITRKFKLTPECKIAFYRITQEALNNVAKHSKAKHAKISLSGGINQTTLRISDDGSGFDVFSISGQGMGLSNMRERAEEIGASFDVKSTIGEGTEITVRCKHKAEEK